MYLLLNLTVFTSAFLLFLIQPMVANILLPKVGGSPNIWNACMVFFQISLLAGYAYSYFVTHRLSLKKQTLLHVIVVFAGIWLIRFNFQETSVSAYSPVAGILLILTKSIALPFILLSATSPLLQRWLSLSDSKYSTVPYSLYVCSNIASLLALLAYPVIIEHYLTFSYQGKLWHFLFICFFFLIGITAFKLYRLPQSEIKEKEISGKKYSPSVIFSWILFAFIPSSLMLGVTNHISVDIGGMPFLWIIPLSLYLISFILTFSRFYTPRTERFFKLFYKAGVFIIPYFFLNAFFNNTTDSLLLITLNVFFYFIFAVTCHGILAGKKPDAQQLTLFYLCLSAGGALGGLFNTFLAPVLFHSYAEYPVILVLSAPFIFNAFPDTAKKLFPLLSCVFLMIAAFFSSVFVAKEFSYIILKQPYLIFVFYALIWISISGYLVLSKNVFLILTVLLMTLFIPTKERGLLYAKRNFMGTVKVIRQDYIDIHLINLLHGSTIHGIQKLDVDGKTYLKDPSAYYGQKAPPADLFNVFTRSFKPSIALVGMGGGALLCYPPEGSKQDIFEIDRDIIEISTKYRLFRFLEMCAPDAVIKEGDGRISLQQEPDGKYDLIIFDVFSSHFIPAHLITKEALSVYQSKLKPDGIFLIHISAKLFDVEPVLSKAASELGWTFLVRQGQMSNEMNSPRWGVMGKESSPEIKELIKMPGWRPAVHDEKTPLWTDDFHNLMSIWRPLRNQI